MAREIFVAIFDSISAAEAAKRDLEAAGIPSADIAIRSGAAESEAGGTSFFDRLFGYQRFYSDHVAQGRALLSITAESSEYDRIASILHGHNLVRTEEEERTTMAPAGGAQEPRETTVPTAKEELQVGKRQTREARAYVIRRYVVEHPVEQQVQLHDERVTVERRQPTQAAAGKAPFEERIIEITETREEPVVSKVVRPGEEVVVRKEGRDRTETVRDTVRESKVEVEKAGTGEKPPSARR